MELAIAVAVVHSVAAGAFFSTVSNWGGVAGVLGFVIAVGALFGRSERTAKQAQLISNYRESATSWQSLAESRDEEIRQLNEKIITQENEIAALTARVRILEDLATGRSAVEQLATQLTDIFARIEDKIVSKADFDVWREEVRAALAKITALANSGPDKEGHGRTTARS